MQKNKKIKNSPKESRKLKVTKIILTKDLIQFHYTFLKLLCQLKKLHQKIGPRQNGLIDKET